MNKPTEIPTIKEDDGKKNYREYLMTNTLRVKKGKPSRILHKELKKHFGRKSGMPLAMRYPNLPIVISIVSILMSVLLLILYYA